MKLVHLLRVGKTENSMLEFLAPDDSPKSSGRMRDPSLRPGSNALSITRNASNFILPNCWQRVVNLVRPKDWRFLAVADVDLYIPILKYVFGEAQIGGPCAVVSTYRLRQEFYGLDADDALLRQRLLKECVHEIGHTLDLRHCQDYRCVMASSHAVEWIDLRETYLCEACHSILESNWQLPGQAAEPLHHKSALP